ncbi:MAG: AraC family transcriptional regulator [Bacteroidota bacterium]
MRIQLNQPDLADLLIENSYPTNFVVDNEVVTERVFGANLLGGYGSYKELFLENIHIGYGDMHFGNPVTLLFESDFDTVEMHFVLSGDAISEEQLSRQTIEFHQNQHNILYAKDVKGRVELDCKQGIKVFEINLKPTFFEKYMPDSHPIFHQFLTCLHQKKTTVLSPRHYPITPAMHHLIREILTCQRKGLFKKMFLESKVIELLLLQLKQISEQNNNVTTSLKKEDVEKIYAVRQIIHDNLYQSCTLLNLAQQVGTNEFTLKKGFKEVFGATVFNYWQELKMQEAKRMLLEEGKTVAEVASLVGYKHAQHFSTAFKRMFGVSPSGLR